MFISELECATVPWIMTGDTLLVAATAGVPLLGEADQCIQWDAQGWTVNKDMKDLKTARHCMSAFKVPQGLLQGMQEELASIPRAHQAGIFNAHWPSPNREPGPHLISQAQGMKVPEVPPPCPRIICGQV